MQKLTSNQNQSRPPGIVLHRPIRFSTAQYFSTFYPCLIPYRDASLSSTRKKKEEGEDNDENKQEKKIKKQKNEKLKSANLITQN